MAEETKPSKEYKGNCHCGKVRFTATVSPLLDDGHEVLSCNCSICARNGYLWVYLPEETNVVWHQGRDDLTVRLLF